MNCPQCGSGGYEPGTDCKTCGYNAVAAEAEIKVQRSMNKDTRDVMNGVGLGCSVLCFVWFFVESFVFALAAHDPASWSTYGPIMSVGIPLAVGIILYLLLRVKPSNFSKGIGYSLLITLILAVAFAYIGTKYHDTMPSSNPAKNGFE
jgi:hypothetical protein